MLDSVNCMAKMVADLRAASIKENDAATRVLQPADDFGKTAITTPKYHGVKSAPDVLDIEDVSLRPVHSTPFAVSGFMVATFRLKTMFSLLNIKYT